MLVRARQLLVPEGRVACLFYWNPSIRQGNLRWAAGRLLSWLTLGNFSLEKGDILKNNQEFLHAFSDQDDLQAEFAEAGFEVLRFVFLMRATMPAPCCARIVECAVLSFDFS
jgi:hypothetical protein